MKKVDAEPGVKRSAKGKIMVKRQALEPNRLCKPKEAFIPDRVQPDTAAQARSPACHARFGISPGANRRSAPGLSVGPQSSA